MAGTDSSVVDPLPLNWQLIEAMTSVMVSIVNVSLGFLFIGITSILVISLEKYHKLLINDCSHYPGLDSINRHKFY